MLEKFMNYNFDWKYFNHEVFRASLFLLWCIVAHFFTNFTITDFSKESFKTNNKKFLRLLYHFMTLIFSQIVLAILLSYFLQKKYIEEIFLFSLFSFLYITKKITSIIVPELKEFPIYFILLLFPSSLITFLIAGFLEININYLIIFLSLYILILTGLIIYKIRKK